MRECSNGFSLFVQICFFFCISSQLSLYACSSIKRNSTIFHIWILHSRLGHDSDCLSSSVWFISTQVHSTVDLLSLTFNLRLQQFSIPNYRISWFQSSFFRCYRTDQYPFSIMFFSIQWISLSDEIYRIAKGEWTYVGFHSIVLHLVVQLFLQDNVHWSPYQALVAIHPWSSPSVVLDINS